MKKINKIIIALLLCTLSIGCEKSTFKIVEGTKYIDEAFNNEFYLQVLNEEGEEQPEISGKFLTVINSLVKNYNGKYEEPGMKEGYAIATGAGYMMSDDDDSEVNGITMLKLPGIIIDDKVKMDITSQFIHFKSDKSNKVRIEVLYRSSEPISDPKIIFNNGDLENLFNLCTGMKLPQKSKTEIEKSIMDSTYSIKYSEENDKFEVMFMPFESKGEYIYLFQTDYLIN